MERQAWPGSRAGRFVVDFPPIGNPPCEGVTAYGSILSDHQLTLGAALPERRVRTWSCSEAVELPPDQQSHGGEPCCGPLLVAEMDVANAVDVEIRTYRTLKWSHLGNWRLFCCESGAERFSSQGLADQKQYNSFSLSSVS
jgi:hypothetical protein